MQTEEPCLSTRGPRKLAFISASLAIAAATWMPPDAQRARADIGKKTGLAHVRNPGVAESLRLPLPTQRGETVRATCVSMGTCAHARGRVLRKSRAEKPGFRRSEPSRVKLGSSRLSCPAWPSERPDGPFGHARLHPSRPCCEKHRSRDPSRDLYFLRNPEPRRFPPNSPQFFPILSGKHQPAVCL